MCLKTFASSIPMCELNRSPSDCYLPFSQLANGLRESLFEQGVEVLVGRLGWFLQRPAMVGRRLARLGCVQIQ